MKIYDKDVVPGNAIDLKLGTYWYRKDGRDNYSLVIMDLKPHEYEFMRQEVKRLHDQKRIYLSRENPGGSVH